MVDVEYSFLGFGLLLVAGLALALLHGALGSKCIDVRLTIISLLLHLPQVLYLTLLLILDPPLLRLKLRLLPGFSAVVSSDLLFFLLLLEDPFLLDEDCALVRSKDLIEHVFGLDLLGDCGLGVVLLQLGDCLKHELALFLPLLLGTNPDQLPLLDLLDDDVVVLLLPDLLTTLLLLLLLNGL